MSSAYLRLLIFLPAILTPCCASSSPAFLMMYSPYKLNKQGDNIQPWRIPSPIWNQSLVPCWFLTCIQISQETNKVVWYSHLFQNFPQFVVIHTVKGFGIVNKAEVDVFMELSCHKEVRKPPNPSLRPNPRHIPTLAPYKEPNHPPLPAQVKSQGNFYLFSLTHVGAWATIKPCLNFLSCL